MYQERRDILYNGLRKLGLKVKKPEATFYLWVSCPEGVSSMEFTSLLLKKAGILTTPGNGFGEDGEGYVRFALTVSVKRTKEAIERINSLVQTKVG